MVIHHPYHLPCNGQYLGRVLGNSLSVLSRQLILSIASLQSGVLALSLAERASWLTSGHEMGS